MTGSRSTRLTKSILVGIFIAASLMCSNAKFARAADEAVGKLIADFRKVLHEDDYQKTMSDLDELTKRGEHLGINFAPAYYLQALRETTHANGQNYAPLFKAIDSSVTASAFLLPELNNLSSISFEQKQ